MSRGELRERTSRRGPHPIDEASRWLVTLSESDSNPTDREAFVAWLRRSNLHVEEFLRVSAMARRLRRSSAWPATSIEELVAEARAERSKVTELPGCAPAENAAAARGRGRVRWVVASCSALALGVIAFAVLWMTGALGSGGQVYATGRGELRSITLNDGSIVQLNTQSAIQARFSDEERSVDLLDGEAIFKVAKNPTRPFSVKTGAAVVVAVGTQFNVYAQPGRTAVTVIEGRVRVTESGSQARAFDLGAGEQVVIDQQRTEAQITRVDSNKVTGWTQRRLYFDDTPLSQVVAELARYNSRSIRIADDDLARRRISGTFDSSDPGALVDFLVRFAGATAQQTQDGWLLASHSPSE